MREFIPDGWGLVGKGALAIGFGAWGSNLTHGCLDAWKIRLDAKGKIL